MNFFPDDEAFHLTKLISANSGICELKARLIRFDLANFSICYSSYKTCCLRVVDSSYSQPLQRFLEVRCLNWLSSQAIRFLNPNLTTHAITLTLILSLRGRGFLYEIARKTIILIFQSDLGTRIINHPGVLLYFQFFSPCFACFGHFSLHSKILSCGDFFAALPPSSPKRDSSVAALPQDDKRRRTSAHRMTGESSVKIYAVNCK